MKISVSKDAARWYREELHLQAGDALRFFVQYGGYSTLQKGFSLGIRQDTPALPAAKATVDDISFFIEQDDEWYFEGHDLSVTYSSGDEYPQFSYQKAG
ncbi:HesB/YadR/YfhF family protein [Ectobacillus ponti]|uniref:HesB/YadR/YfhF family protein n=1 Tax=Ectobacillus ponti TaxID=2961894 RepID=A0AA41X5H9_9BACI|nr:HesB/YadR/YfhF family protein [Ectobacillus ponti]MCP8969137.1 HesB/YadR/YfhF family protein [Ectobacillus ponti]